MNSVLVSLIATLRAGFRSRIALQVEIPALRRQVNILRRFSKAATSVRIGSCPLGMAVAAMFQVALLIVRCNPQSSTRQQTKRVPKGMLF
jgi:hypothetical protein